MTALDHYKVKAKVALRKIIPDPLVRGYKIRRQRDNYVPSVGKIEFGDFRRLKPMSHDFGYARGGPIDRYYIEKFLAQHAADIKGHVLEMEDNKYTLRYGQKKVAKSDILDVNLGNRKATIIADLTDARHIPANSFDCVILAHFISMIHDYNSALRTIHRILKRSGVLLLTSGVGFKMPRNPDHMVYWNISDACFKKILGEYFPLEKITTRRHGNVLTMSCFLYGVGRGELSAREFDHDDIDYPVIFSVRAVKE